MSVNLNQFKSAAIDGVVRLEINKKGSDINIKGNTPGGKFVEWLRTSLGLRKEENQRTFETFVTALKSQYGGDITSIAETGLRESLENGVKPLSGRVCKQVLEQADQLLNQRNNSNLELAKAFSTPGNIDLERVVGQAITTLDGVSKTAIQSMDDLTLPNNSEMLEAIKRQVAADGKNGTVQLSREQVETIALRIVSEALTQRSNEETALGILDCEDRLSDFQQFVTEIAEKIGIPSLGSSLSDPESPSTKSLIKTITGIFKQPATESEIRSKMLTIVPRILVGNITRDTLSELKTLPTDPNLCVMVIKNIKLQMENMKLEDKQKMTSFIASHLDKLDPGTESDREIKNELRGFLEFNYKYMTDSKMKLGFLELKRDFVVKNAENIGIKGVPNWNDAFACQSDIIALHLKDMGKTGIALTKEEMSILADESEDLRKAMAKMDELGLAFQKALGGDEKVSKLDWLDGRDQLAVMRNKARLLQHEGDGNHLQGLIANSMRNLTADMLQRAAEIMGPPPTPYSVISLGSAARGEASPYSDVEFGILLEKPADEETRKYFVNLSKLVEIQVMMLGENPGMESPTGFHWDGGGNSPATTPQNFVGTAEQLIEANLKIGENGGAANSNGLTMFIGPELLFGSKGTDEDFALVKDFQKKIEKHFTSKVDGSKTTIGQILGRWIANDGQDVAKVSDNLNVDQVNIKQISRLPMLLVQGLALENGIIFNGQGDATNSTLMRIGALVEKGILTREEGDTLTNAAIALGKARIEAHLKAGRESNEAFLVPTDDENAYVNEGLRDVIKSLIPFAERVKRHVENPQKPF